MKHSYLISEEPATVIDINTTKWTVNAIGKNSGVMVSEIPIEVVYSDHISGAVVIVMPAVDTEGTIIRYHSTLEELQASLTDKVSNTTISTNLYSKPAKTYFRPGRLVKIGDEGYSGGISRPPLCAGDILLQTASGANMVLRAGDMIEIAVGEGNARRHYQGQTNTIVDESSNYLQADDAVKIESGELTGWVGGDINPAVRRTSFFYNMKSIGPLGTLPVAISQTGTTDWPRWFSVWKLLNGLYEKSISLLGEVLEKSIKHVIESQDIRLGGEDAFHLIPFFDKLQEKWNQDFLTHIHIEHDGPATGSPAGRAGATGTFIEMMQGVDSSLISKTK